MRIKDLRPHTPISAYCADTLRSGAMRLVADDIGALVVYGSHGPVGVFSERDLARAVADEADLDRVQLKDYMTEAPVTVDQNEKITTGITKMNEFGVRHLIVADAGEIVGVVSTRDIISHLDGHPVRA